MSSTLSGPLFQQWKTVLVDRFWGAGLLLSALWLMLFNQLHVEWSINPQYSYGWLVPFLGAYLLLRRWETRPEPAQIASTGFLPVGIAAISAFLLLPGRVFQEANPDWRLVSWWLAFCVLALTLLALYWTGGSSWLQHFSFPFLFMLLAVPWPSMPEQWVIQHMMQSVTTVTVEALNWCGIFARQRGNLIELPSGVVGINEACSGVRSLQSTLMAALFIGELSRLAWSRRLCLLGLGVALAFVLNCLRAFILATMHTMGGAKNLERWHDPAGYAILLVSFGALLLLAKWLSPPEDPPQAITANPGSMKRFPGFLLAGLGLWLLFCEAGTELWYRSHESGFQKKILWSLSWPEESETFQKQKIPETAQIILRYNEGIYGAFKRPDGTFWGIFEMVWQPGRVSAQLARSHSPEVCMPANGARIISQSGPEFWKIGPVSLPVQLYTFRAGSQIWHVYYIVWEERLEQTPLEDPQGFYGYGNKILAVTEGRRHLGQRVVQVITRGYQDPESAKKAVFDYLQNHIRLH